ncbi:MAG: YbbR-like domain-containing protein [Prevotella sp.]|nr:YbbR-like domain-containing protein [Prevotella sp.]
MSSPLRKICRQSNPVLRKIRPRRSFFVFLVFLVLSGLFWLSTALNGYYDYELDLPVVVTGLPSNIILTGDSADVVRVAVHDKGFALLQYSRLKNVRALVINFPTYQRQGNKCVLSAAELHKLITKRLQGSTTINSIKPERIELSYVEGVGKSVPVRLTGNIEPAKNYYLEHTELHPSHVTLYAPAGEIDSVRYAYTEELNAVNFTDTLQAMVRLKTVSGQKVVPDEVAVTLYPDVLTEEEAEVRVMPVNVPEGTILRTFPSRVKVRFAVGVSMYRNINTSQFIVEADYGKISEDAEKCPLTLAQIPKGVKQASLVTSEVDYLIEN